MSQRRNSPLAVWSVQPGEVPVTSILPSGEMANAITDFAWTERVWKSATKSRLVKHPAVHRMPFGGDKELPVGADGHGQQGVAPVAPRQRG